MKPSLGLRVSQHLALTPQLQQSIRLLQLSTIELAQEVEQMLQDNPFLEQQEQDAGFEERLQLERDLSEAAVRQENAIDLIANNLINTPASGNLDPQNEFEGENDGYTNTASDTPTDWSGDGSQDMAHDDKEWGAEAPAQLSASSAASTANTADDDFDPASQRGEHIRLQAHLHAQARSLRLSTADQAALYALIESLDDDGYLTDDLEELAHALGARSLEDTEELLAQFTISLKLLQHMEPTGVGARSLQECMQLQLRALPKTDTTLLALQITQQPLDVLARRDVRRLVQLCGESAEKVKAAIALIAKLEPKPGRAFVQVDQQIVIPDVIVRARQQRSGTVFVAELNPEVLPKLMVNDLYAGVLKTAKKDEAAVGLQNRLQEARWFIKNIQQRFDTILRVSQAIVQRQESFFKHGALAMRPLVLREIADEIGMHESTISRVTTAKYMATPWGTFELKYFFGSALNTETGSSASSTAVRELIKQLIDAESKARPLSDQTIADMLAEQGIECARRTVAKYREAMRIPVTSLRKTL
jgi:RNA polymerase sigma-54 factor